MNVVSVKYHFARPIQSLQPTDNRRGGLPVGHMSTAEVAAQPPVPNPQANGLLDNGSTLATAESVISDAAVLTSIASDSSGVEAAKSAMQNTLTDLATDPEKFHEVLKKAFGDGYNRANAETIRQQVINGDFSWMPAVVVVDESQLQDQSGTQSGGTALGAYSAETDTIYLSRELLLSDPEKAAQILTEEMGHALDARLNTSDAAGDEGDIFARLASGESISKSALTALKAENDSGTIVVNGQEIEVEYGLISGIKNAVKGVVDGVKGAVKGVVDGVKGAVKGVFDGVKGLVKGAWEAYTGVLKDVWDAHKKVFKKIAQSKLFQVVLTVAQFVPIPVVQIAAKVVNVAMAAYRVGQGIKNGSVSGILAGVAGVAGGVGKLGGMLGASTNFVDGATRIANGARAAGMAYSAAANRDFTAAAGLASQFFGADSQVGQAFATAGHAHTTVENFKNKNYLGALQSGQHAYSGYQSVLSGDPASSDVVNRAGAANNPSAPAVLSAATSGTALGAFIDSIKGNELFQAVRNNVATIQEVVGFVKDGEHETATRLFLGNYAEALGIGEATQNTINRWAGVIDKVDSVKELADNRNYSAAIDQAAGMLGIPLSVNNQQRLSTVFAIRNSVLGKHYATASRQAATLSMQSGRRDLASSFLQLANMLDGRFSALGLNSRQQSANAA